MSGVSGTCEKCGAHIESLSRYDYSVCECGHAMLDGGNVFYVRRRGIKEDTYRTWDWTTADGRRLKAAEMSTEHLKAIIKDGYDLSGVMREEATKRGLSRWLEEAE